jgi:hypothetical protein
MPKKITRDVARQLREMSEEVIKEGARQPVRLVETMGKQIGFLPANWGESLETPVSSQAMAEKKKKEGEKKAKELKFWRERKRELVTKGQARPETTEEEFEEMEKRKKEAEEAERMKPLEEPAGKKPRGMFLGAKRRQEKAQPEMAGRRHSG